MELFETLGNPMPANPIVSSVRTRDGLNLRVARWSAASPRGTVLLAIGRSEFIEEYYEIIATLLARRLDAIVFDWRGQGQSDRETRWLNRGHVSEFAAYRRDLNAIETQILRPFATRPWFGLGHSMGASLLLDQAHDGLTPFDRLILSAPMIDVPLRYKTWIKRLIRGLDRLGFGSRLIPGGKDISIIQMRSFDDNILTSDRRQYDRLVKATTQLPMLSIGSPTIHWVAEAFDLMRRFEEARYAAEILTPVLVVAAGADRIVDTAATERFSIYLKSGRCLTIPNARHQIMMDRPSIIAQFWAAFDAFIPGEALRPARPETPPPSRSRKRSKVGLF